MSETVSNVRGHFQTPLLPQPLPAYPSILLIILLLLHNSNLTVRERERARGTINREWVSCISIKGGDEPPIVKPPYLPRAFSHQKYYRSYRGLAGIITNILHLRGVIYNAENDLRGNGI